MLGVSPFLLFDGNCAEAMTFYAACFGGELVLTRLGDTPMKAQFPEAMHGKVTYAHLKAGAVEISGTDWLHPVQRPVPGNTVAVFVTSEDVEELRGVFGRLAEGAAEDFFVGLMEMPFGLYGRFTDRFGVGWFFRGGAARQAAGKQRDVVKALSTPGLSDVEFEPSRARGLARPADFSYARVKLDLGMGELNSAPKGVLDQEVYGTAEAVPLPKRRLLLMILHGNLDRDMDELVDPKLAQQPGTSRPHSSR